MKQSWLNPWNLLNTARVHLLHCLNPLKPASSEINPYLLAFHNKSLECKNSTDTLCMFVWGYTFLSALCPPFETYTHCFVFRQSHLPLCEPWWERYTAPGYKVRCEIWKEESPLSWFNRPYLFRGLNSQAVWRNCKQSRHGEMGVVAQRITLFSQAAEWAGWHCHG